METGRRKTLKTRQAFFEKQGRVGIPPQAVIFPCSLTRLKRRHIKVINNFLFLVMEPNKIRKIFWTLKSKKVQKKFAFFLNFKGNCINCPEGRRVWRIY